MLCMSFLYVLLEALNTAQGKNQVANIAHTRRSRVLYLSLCDISATRLSPRAVYFKYYKYLLDILLYIGLAQKNQAYLDNLVILSV